MISPPNILLVTPNWRWDSTPLPTDTLCPPVSPPLEMAYISAGLDCEHRFIDAYAADITPEQLAQEIERAQPTTVVVSTTPSLLYWRCPPFSIVAVEVTVRMCRLVTGADVVLMGPHCTFSPDWALSRTGADACWRGAPERCLAKWLTSGESEGPYVQRSGGQAKICIEQASSLPSARMSIFDFEHPYPPHMWCVSDEERRVAADYRSGALAEASRGCPWSCVYCAKAPVRDAFERRQLSPLKDEWAQLRDLGVDYVFFVDETFNLGGSRLHALLEALASSGLSFGFQGRPELISPEQAELLADAGCVYAELGLDVKSEALSTDVGRRQSVSDADDGIDSCRSVIPIVRYNRLNLATLDYRTKLGLSSEDGWDYPPDPAYPYPGARLGELVMALYGRDAFDWDFALRYSWWLRIEVALQRSGEDLDDRAIAERQAKFLALPEAEAREVAEAVNGIQHDSEFLVANKFISGMSV